MSEPQKATIFVIEDNAAVRESFATLFSAVGYHCVAYEGAEDFLEHAAPYPPCCVLTDLHLPGMNGLVLQRIVNMRRPPLPVVFVSGSFRQCQVTQAMDAGALDFLPKPVNAETLLATISRGLEQSLNCL